MKLSDFWCVKCAKHRLQCECFRQAIDDSMKTEATVRLLHTLEHKKGFTGFDQRLLYTFRIQAR